MYQLFKKLASTFHFFMAISVHGMISAPEQPIPFCNAIMKAESTGDTSLLKQYVEYNWQDLNMLFGRLYPVAEIIQGRYDSDLITTGMCNGARVDLRDLMHSMTLFHWIAMCPKLDTDKKYAYSPKKNLLSALALPTYTYPARDAAPQEERARISKERLRAALLCINRMNPQIQKTGVKYTILAFLVEDINSLSLFTHVLEQAHTTEIAQCSFEWFQAVYE